MCVRERERERERDSFNACCTSVPIAWPFFATSVSEASLYACIQSIHKHNNITKSTFTLAYHILLYVLSPSQQNSDFTAKHNYM